MAINLATDYAGGWSNATLKDHLQYLDQWSTLFPDVMVKYCNIQTEVHDEAGRNATTFAEMQMKHMPLNTTRKRIQTFYWKQLAGSWRCTHTVVMEGLGSVGPGV